MKKKAIAWEFVVKLALGLVILALVFLVISKMKGGMGGIVERLREWFG